MKIATRILTAVFMLLVLTFVGVQVLRYATREYVTETALPYSAAETIDTIGIAVRNEQLVDTDRSGVVGYIYEDGSKVAGGSLIVEVYSNRAALNMRSQILHLQSEIDMLTDAQNTGLNYLANTDSLSTQIRADAYGLMQCGDDGDFTDVFSRRIDLLSLMNKRQIATDQIQSFETRIAALQQRYNELSAAVPLPSESVYMPNTGYFSSVTDGWESRLTPEILRNCSVEELQDLLVSVTPTETGKVGKVIRSFTWYCAVVVTAAQAETFTRVGSAEAAFSTLNLRELPFTVYDTVPLEDAAPSDTESPVMVIFSCNYMNAALSALRVQNLELSLKSYSGLRVTKEALRFKDGVKGVYVQVGYNVRFKSIEGSVLYEGTDYVLVAPSDNPEGLQQYDEVVVKGMGLYDGMAI